MSPIRTVSETKGATGGFPFVREIPVANLSRPVMRVFEEEADIVVELMPLAS